MQDRCRDPDVRRSPVVMNDLFQFTAHDHRATTVVAPDKTAGDAMDRSPDTTLLAEGGGSSLFSCFVARIDSTPDTNPLPQTRGVMPAIARPPPPRRHAHPQPFSTIRRLRYCRRRRRLSPRLFPYDMIAVWSSILSARGRCRADQSIRSEHRHCQETRSR